MATLRKAYLTKSCLLKGIKRKDNYVAGMMALRPSGLGNYSIRKRFAVQTLLWSLEFVIQRIEYDTIPEWITIFWYNIILISVVSWNHFNFDFNSPIQWSVEHQKIKESCSQIISDTFTFSRVSLRTNNLQAYHYQKLFQHIYPF